MPNDRTIPTNSLRPSDYVRVEAAALTALAQRLDTTMLAPFTQAIDRILAQQSEKPTRVITTGIGKSGIIARKLAATLRSTGTPAHFLHPAEAIHGDIGMHRPRRHRPRPLLQRRNRRTPPHPSVPQATRRNLDRLLQQPHLQPRPGRRHLPRHQRRHRGLPAQPRPHRLHHRHAGPRRRPRPRAQPPQKLARRRLRRPPPRRTLGQRLARVRKLMHTGEALPQVAPTTPMPRSSTRCPARSSE